MKKNEWLLDIIDSESKTKEWFNDFKKNRLSVFGEFDTVLNDYIKEFETYRETYSNYLQELNYIDLTRDEAKEQLKVLIDKYKEDPNKFDNFIELISVSKQDDNKLYKFISSISSTSLNNIKSALREGQDITEKDICVMGIYKDDIDFYDKKDYFAVFEKELEEGYISLTQSEIEYLKNNPSNKTNESLEVKIFKLKKIRQSNMEQKYTHTIRMLAITINQLNTELYRDFPEIMKISMLVGVLFHDLGRFYQAAFYNDFIDENLSYVELEYNHEIDELQGIMDEKENKIKFRTLDNESLSHSILGFYFSFNSFKNLNSLEPDNIKKIIDVVAAYAIRKHSLPNNKLHYLDNINLSSFKNFSIEELVKTIDALYEESEEIRSDRGAFDLLSNDVFVRNQLNNLFTKLETVEIKQEFFNVLFKFLKNYKSSTDIESNKEEIKTYLLIKFKNIKEPIIDLIIDIIINNFKKIKDFLSQVDYNIPRAIDKNLKGPNPDLELKKVVAITTLTVMDLDKIDILVQLAKGRMKDGISSFIPIKANGRDLETISEFVNKICRKYGINDMDFIYKTIENMIKFHRSNKINESDDKLIKVPVSEIYSIAEKCIEFNKSLDLNKAKRDLILSTSLPIDSKNRDIKQYFLFGKEETKSDNFIRTDNFIGKLWWRIEQFVLTNMRLVNSLKTIKDLEILDKIVFYYEKQDPIYADVIKPIIYYAKSFIDVALKYAKDKELVSFTADNIKEIREYTNNEVQLEMLEFESEIKNNKEISYIDIMISLYEYKQTQGITVKNTGFKY